MWCPIVGIKQANLFEWKKIFLYKKGWLILLAALLLAPCVWIVVEEPLNMEIELYRESYQYYLQDVKGQLTEEKIQYIESAASKAAAASGKITQLYLDFYAGDIPEEEFQKQMAEWQEIAIGYQGMNALYEQYLYARQMKEERYLVYPNGWFALLGDDTLNFILIGALALLLIPLFCGEYSCGMDCLAMTTVNGGHNFGVQKTAVTLLLSGGLQMLLISERYLFCLVKYGLPDGEFPLQSIAYFAESPYHISLWQAFWGLSLIKIFGAVFLGAILCFAAVWARNGVAACLLVVCVVWLPYVSLGDSLQYHMPVPVGFLRAAGFLSGDETSLDGAGQEIVSFSHVTVEQFVVLVLVSVSIAVACVIFVWYHGRNKILLPVPKSAARKTWGRIPVVFMLLTLGIGCGLAGCGGIEEKVELEMPYNSRTASVYQDGHIWVSAIGGQSNKQILLRKSDGEEVRLDRSPFREGSILGGQIYSDGNTVYYMESLIADNSNIRLSQKVFRTTVRILKMIPETMEEDCVFEVSYEGNGSEWDFLSQMQGFFLDEQSIWFIGSTEVRQVDRRTKRIKVMDIAPGLNVAYDGRGIYYIDNAMRIACYDTDTETTSYVGEVAAGVFVLAPEGIYYSNLRDHKYLYFSTLDGSDIRLVDSREVLSLQIEGDELKYYVVGSSEVCARKLSGK